ncbi:hypothetical protein [Rubrimonas cliftonensis]|uniref:Uncharacterized protein n=1 Tax=Rubrimonas cliftonensis TaxID=89524 RepID=A0A1H4ETW7_9RHOB|nr:hypothetical protein [Rubrimonas cliftonensis]SEA88000.1 hypothetical protein SAMN05444370_11582 [Rubrimonas cliftonensis]
MPPLLKPRPAPPRMRKISFNAPEDLADELEALKARAEALGYELPLNDALVEAYRKLVRRVADELDAGPREADRREPASDAPAPGSDGPAQRSMLDAAE